MIYMQRMVVQLKGELMLWKKSQEGKRKKYII